MISKWFNLKPEVIKMRQKGISIRNIEKRLVIPRSTLSGWFKNVLLSEEQKRVLNENRINHLYKARRTAILWHNQQKELRLKKAELEAVEVLSKIEINNKNVLELGLAMLYLGDGSKTTQTSMGNSDPLILRFFIDALVEVYKIDKNII